MIVSFLLANRCPLLLWWGPDYVSIYNDAYRPVLGAKHPLALGRPFREVWPEIRHVLEPLIDAPFNGGPATWMEDIPLEINRYGFFEETHFTIAYSPVPDNTAPRGIGGVLAMAHDITEKIVGERRISALRDLAMHSGEARTVEEACSIALEALKTYPKDVPFAAVYLFDSAHSRAHLACATGVEPGAPTAGAVIDLDVIEAENQWPVAEFLRRQSVVTVENLTKRFSEVPRGPWSDPPHSAVIVPIKSNIAHQLAGFLVAGVSPRLLLDDGYRGFFDLVAGQIATVIATARAYEDERRRAEALAEIDRAKTQFFSNVSHEFRTPLTLMLAPLEDGLADAGLPAEERERLDLVHRNSLRLLRLVNSLLDFSRIEAGRAQASYEPTDLASVTRELASNFRSICERAGLRLVVDCPRLSEPVYIDRGMWEKIVLNLLSNAFKFTFDGAIEVRLQALDGWAELSVRDSGGGIPEHELPRLFERFHRIEGQKSRTYEGSGIGLALVQELVKLHGGAIDAESAVGIGTIFTVAVPFGTAHLEQSRIGAEPSLAPTSVRAEAYVEEALRWLPTGPASKTSSMADEARALPPLYGKKRVLIADDNADMRGYVQRLLESRWEVDAAADGEAALEALRTRRPDLVLADVMMPRLDGFGLLRAVRDDPVLCDIPVIMLSARAGEESRIEGLEQGADAYLVKPFSARDLVARVSASLEISRVRREAADVLRKSEDKYRSLFEKMAQGCAEAEILRDAEGHAIDYRLLEMNPAFEKLVGVSAVEARGQTVRRVLPGIEDWWIETFDRIVQSGKSERFEHEVRPLDRWYEVHAYPRGGDRFATLFDDVTHRRRAENARRERGDRQAFLLKFSDALRAQRDAEAVANAALRLLAEHLHLDRAFMATLQYDEGHGAITHETRSPDCPSIVGPFRMSDFPGPAKKFAERAFVIRDVATDPDLSELDRRSLAALDLGAYVAVPLRKGGQGHPFWVLTAASTKARDWTAGEIALLENAGERTWAAVERARAEETLRRNEEHLRLLIGELNHRVKNTLATVQSFARQSLRNAPSLAEGHAAFDARLIALSKAHNVLVREHWDGASLSEVVGEALDAYSGGERESRVSFGGPNIRLEPKAALALSMALHELATNAVKYGALSNASGEIRVNWQVNPESPLNFVLRWMERKGPAVMPPLRRGFGSRLIERGLSQDLAGEVKLEFEPDGVICTIAAPLNEIRKKTFTTGAWDAGAKPEPDSADN